QAGELGSVFNSRACETYGMEKEAPGEGNSHTLAGGLSCADRGTQWPAAERAAPDPFQRTTVTTIRDKNSKFRAGRILRGEVRFSTPARFRRLARTPRATLSPFLAGEAPMRGCNALRHKAV